MWGWLEDLIGEELPKGDGEACKNQAKEWKSLADDLKKLKTDAETAQSTTLLGFIDGQYREGLDPWFNGLIDNIDGLISNFELLAERLEHVGEEIRTTKIRFWVDFALLASNLLVFGGPGLILLKTAAKALAKRLVARAVEKVAFKKITTSAITVAVKRRAATVLSKNFVKKVGVPAAVGAGLGLGQDAARQGILLANHAAVDSNGRPTSQFNLGSTLKAGASGLIMGGIGGGVISKFAPKMNGNVFKEFGVHFAGNFAGTIAGEAAVYQHFDPTKAAIMSAAFGAQGVAGDHMPPLGERAAPSHDPPDGPGPATKVYPEAQAPAHVEQPAHAPETAQPHETPAYRPAATADTPVQDSISNGPLHTTGQPSQSAAAAGVKTPTPAAAPEAAAQRPAESAARGPVVEGPRPGSDGGPSGPPLKAAPAAEASLSAATSEVKADARSMASLPEAASAGSPEGTVRVTDGAVSEANAEAPAGAVKVPEGTAPAAGIAAADLAGSPEMRGPQPSSVELTQTGGPQVSHGQIDSSPVPVDRGSAPAGQSVTGSDSRLAQSAGGDRPGPGVERPAAADTARPAPEKPAAPGRSAAGLGADAVETRGGRLSSETGQSAAAGAYGGKLPSDPLTRGQHPTERPDSPAAAEGSRDQSVPADRDDSVGITEGARAADGHLKVSGHGSYEPPNGKAVVPEGTSVTVFGEHGGTITDALGNRIETGQDVAGVFSRTYTAGEEMPNYTLHPPEGLDIQGTPHTVENPTLLSDLLKPNQGPVDWAACVYGEFTPGGAEAPGRHMVFDVDGIYNEKTGASVHYEEPDAPPQGPRASGGDHQANRAPDHIDDAAAARGPHPDEISGDSPAAHLDLPEYTPGTLSNAETRTVYAHGELRMQELNKRWIEEGVPVQERAHRMFETRNELREWARTLMADREAAAHLSANEKMMTWDRLVEKTEAKGFSGDRVFQEIIDSSTRSRPGVNDALGIDPHNPPPLPPHDGPAVRDGAIPDAGKPPHERAALTEDARSREPERSGPKHDNEPGESSRKSLTDDVNPQHETSPRGNESQAAHTRAIADEALSRRIPPVDPEGIRTPLGNGERAPGHTRDNADWWNSLRADEQRALIESYPEHVGNAEGIPLEARHEANSNSLNNARDELHNKLESGDKLSRPERKELERLDKLHKDLADAKIAAEAVGVGGPHLLAFDSKAFGGDGRALVSFGDNPYHADSVSWHVPGLTTTIDKLGVNMSNALEHLKSVRKEDGSLSASSIAWIGYDAPSGRGFLGVVGHGMARTGGNILHADIRAFNTAHDALAGDGSHFSNNHVFGHSYGSTTTSYAGHDGRLAGQIQTVTLLGSPGAGPHHTAESFRIGRENVFVASSSRDWVTTLGGRDSDGRFLRHFGLGRDPAMESWGGRRITAEFPPSMDTLKTAGTHSAYYHSVEGAGQHPVRSESLANFGRIASGHPERVDFEMHRTVDERPGWQLGLRTDEPAAGRPLRLDDDAGHGLPTDRRGLDPRWHSDYGAVDGQPRHAADSDSAAVTHDRPDPNEGRHAATENVGRDCLPRTADAFGELTGRPIRIDAEPTSSGLPARLIFEGTGSAAHFSSYAEVAARLREMGDGASALVASRWTGGHDGGHVVLAVNRGGEIHLVDRAAGIERGGWPPSWGDRAVDRVAVGYFDAHGNPVARMGGEHSLAAADAVGDVAGRRLYDHTPGEPTVRLRPDLSAREGLAVTERRFPDWTAHILPDGLNKQLATLSESAARSFLEGHPNVQHVDRTRVEFDYPPGSHREFSASHVKEVEVTVGKNSAKFTIVDGVPVRAKFTLEEVFTGLDRSSNESAAQRSLDLLLSDDAGHMSGFRFTLDQGGDNLFPQDSNFNRGAYKVMENEWASFAANGGRVEATVNLIRDPADPLGRPTKVVAAYKIYDTETGQLAHAKVEKFDNSSGQGHHRLATPEIQKLLAGIRASGDADFSRSDPIHSDEAAGPGWQRDADNFRGQGAPTTPWRFIDDPANSAQMTPDVAKLMDDPAHPLGLDPRGVPYNARTYSDDFNMLGPTGEHWMKYPDNDGAVAGTRVSFDSFQSFREEYGVRVDRIGPDDGGYLGLMENGRAASWEERALHVDSLREPYSTFALDNLPPGWKIEVSEIAPGMGQRGGGIQVRVLNGDNKVQPVSELRKLRVLIRVER